MLIAASLMENHELHSLHKNSKWEKSSSLRVDDEIKPSFPWREPRGVPKAMMVKFDCWISLYKDSSEFGLISFCSSIAPHAWCTRSEVTNKFAHSKPLLNLSSRTEFNEPRLILSSRTEFNACAVQISKIYSVEPKKFYISWKGKKKKTKLHSSSFLQIA